MSNGSGGEEEETYTNCKTYSLKKHKSQIEQTTVGKQVLSLQLQTALETQ